MKKIIAAISMLAVFGTASAASVTVEGQALQGVNGASDSAAFQLGVRQKIANSVSADLQFSQTVVEDTKTLSSRLEAGLSATMPVGSFTGYTRVALGERFRNGSNYSYYSVEPGVIYNVTNSVSVRAGFRFRDAFSGSVTDQTRTARVGASYALSKTDTVGVRYDRIRGDSNSDGYSLFYTRNF